jgi:hypothetical protein
VQPLVLGEVQPLALGEVQPLVLGEELVAPRPALELARLVQ